MGSALEKINKSSPNASEMIFCLAHVGWNENWLCDLIFQQLSESFHYQDEQARGKWIPLYEAPSGEEVTSERSIEVDQESGCCNAQLHPFNENGWRMH